MSKPLPPCYGCAERHPACQIPERCERWADYQKRLDEFHAARRKAKLAEEDMLKVRTFYVNKPAQQRDIRRKMDRRK